MQSRVFYTVLSAAIYHIWGARNLYIFHSIRQKKEAICHRIVQEVSYCMASWRNMPNSAVNLRIAGVRESAGHIFRLNSGCVLVYLHFRCILCFKWCLVFLQLWLLLLNRGFCSGFSRLSPWSLVLVGVFLMNLPNRKTKP